MAEMKILGEGQAARTIAERDKLAFALFLGAGASKSSGVILASEMIGEWRQMAFREANPAGIEFEAWCQQQKDWFEAENEYSLLFETVYQDQKSRQRYIERKIEPAFPSWGYLYLANIVQHGRFNVIYTTNFDDLINEALTIFLGYNPVVCAADSEVATINLTTERAKIVKLHGDYLFDSFMKNTAAELQSLDKNMRDKFGQFALQQGLVVIGYSGCDQSIMGALEELLTNAAAYPHGVYWGLRPGDKVASRVEALGKKYPQRFHLFTCSDFDCFLARLHDICGGKGGAPAPLELPDTIVAPYQSLEKRYQLLVNAAGPDSPETIRKHIAKLQEELSRPWAKAKGDDFDLLQAQLALGRRDYKAALQVIEGFVAKHPENADAQTAWGNALHIRAEEEGSAALAKEAVAKWKEAIRLNPAAQEARYSLGRHYMLKQRSVEAIAVLEELLELTPNDIGLRRNLVSLYGAASRFDAAETQLDWLLQREAESADLHAMRASLYEQRGLIPQAVEAMSYASKLAPNNPWFHFALSGALAKTNRIAEAADELERAIALDPGNLNFRIQAGMFYLAQQNLPQAQQHLRTAVDLGPNSAEAHGWLSDVLRASGNFPAAYTEAQQAVGLSPKDSRIQTVAGMAAQCLNQPQAAEAYFKNAVQLNPSAPQAYAALCLLYDWQGRGYELNATFSTLSQISPQIAQAVQMQLQMQQAQRMQQPAQPQAWFAALQQQFFGQPTAPPPPPPPNQPPPIPFPFHRPR